MTDIDAIIEGLSEAQKVLLHELALAPDLCFNFGGLHSVTGIPRETIKAALRDMREKELAYFQTGLMTDNGEMAGSGYGVTTKGQAVRARLLGDK